MMDRAAEMWTQAGEWERIRLSWRRMMGIEDESADLFGRNQAVETPLNLSNFSASHNPSSRNISGGTAQGNENRNMLTHIPNEPFSLDRELNGKGKRREKSSKKTETTRTVTVCTCNRILHFQRSHFCAFLPPQQLLDNAELADVQTRSYSLDPRAYTIAAAPATRQATKQPEAISALITSASAKFQTLIRASTSSAYLEPMDLDENDTAGEQYHMNLGDQSFKISLAK
ncbi:hypothetical protein BJ742DRAFT_833838 [Cladochytrium replicatum]|nr:hypothetical protein BJ742DRAFT_833838 [Cladochytrium replicatum]